MLEVASDLVYVAARMNKNLLDSQPKTPEKTAALEYHDRIEKGKRSFVERFKLDCPDYVNYDKMKELFD